MGKSAFIIDTPESCKECPLSYAVFFQDNIICYVRKDKNQKSLPSGKKNFDDCPLKTIGNDCLFDINVCKDSVKTLADIIEVRKNKYDDSTGADYYKGYATGWHWAYQDMKEILEQHGVDLDKEIINV